MPKVFTSKTQKIGELGEKIAEIYLVSKGFEIIDRNYTKKVGEIDIICKKANIIHFIEVKSVSRESRHVVSYETIRPEENMHPKKIERFVKTVEYYLMEKNVSSSFAKATKDRHETRWQIDLLCVYIDKDNKKAQVKFLEQII